MAEQYTSGLQKIIYQATASRTGLLVTVRFCCSSDESAVMERELVESIHFPGIYSFDYNFSSGMFLASFFEDGIKATSQVYRFTKDTQSNKGFLGPQVLQ